MKELRLKKQYVGFKIHANDNRFREDLSQEEIQQLISVGFGKFFEEKPEESLYEKAEKAVKEYKKCKKCGEDKCDCLEEVKGKELKVKAVPVKKKKAAAKKKDK